MRRRRYALGALILGLFVVTLTACGGTHGSVRNSRVHCNSRMGSGSCEGTFGAVNGNYTYTVEDVDRVPGAPLTVDVEVTITSGELRVSLETSDGEALVKTARPDQPARIAGVAAADNQGHLSLRLSVPEGQVAEGVAFRIDWELQ